MKIVQLNATCGVGSTGKICVDISKLSTEKGIENYILYTQGNSDYPLGIKYADEKYTKIQALKSRIFGNYGFNSQRATKKLITKLEEIKPTIVHLHNLHGHNCNLETLFKYFKKTNIKLLWTFHDCWTFTGYCPHFDMIDCYKWESHCCDCPLRRDYSWFFDKSEQLYEKKRRLFADLDLTIITPSKWLGEMVKRSFLQNCKIKVINNGIDLDMFKSTESDFRERYGLQDKHIVLGVAFDWGSKKGLDCFVELSKRLPDNYQVVLVGTNKSVDRHLPGNVLSIHKTQNQKELSEIYTAADIFVNCTREENFPTVNMESLACGTPVLTFNTGGSPEIIDETCGSVVPKNDINALENEIIRICEDKPYSVEKCRLRVSENFEKTLTYQKYMEMYFA